MSSMLDRYLYAVQNDLPKDQPAADIIAEIGDDLQSQMDERSATLGRPLTEEEQAALIKAYGHPRIVAGRYNRVQYLVGPETFPFYFSTLRLVLVVVVTIELLAGAISSLVTHNGFLFFEALGAAWNSLIWIFGIVTVVFALGERTHDRASFLNPFKWDPRRLPAPNAWPPVPRTSSMAEFIANFLALLVLLDAAGPHHIPLDAVAGEHVAGNAILADAGVAWRVHRNDCRIGALGGIGARRVRAAATRRRARRRSRSCKRRDDCRHRVHAPSRTVDSVARPSFKYGRAVLPRRSAGRSLGTDCRLRSRASPQTGGTPHGLAHLCRFRYTLRLKFFSRYLDILTTGITSIG